MARLVAVDTKEGHIYEPVLPVSYTGPARRLQQDMRLGYRVPSDYVNVARENGLSVAAETTDGPTARWFVIDTKTSAQYPAPGTSKGFATQAEADGFKASRLAHDARVGYVNADVVVKRVNFLAVADETP